MNKKERNHIILASFSDNIKLVSSGSCAVDLGGVNSEGKRV